jgi:hypothetical protein
MSKYWQGPAGVFYDEKQDLIFLLEWEGSRLYNFKKGKDIAPMFEYRARGIHHRKVAVTGMRNTIRLGDL